MKKIFVLMETDGYDYTDSIAVSECKEALIRVAKSISNQRNSNLFYIELLPFLEEGKVEYSKSEIFDIHLNPGSDPVWRSR